MSVSTLICHPQVRALLDELVPRKLGDRILYQRSTNCPILVPKKTTTHGSIIGTAYDYAFRFEMARLVPEAQYDEWVAELAARGLMALARQMERRYERLLEQNFYVRSWRDPAALQPADWERLVEAQIQRQAQVAFQSIQRARKAAVRVKNARIFFRQHLKRKECEEFWLRRLAVHALKLARLDPYYRAKYIGPALFEPDDDLAVNEIVELLKRTPFSRWTKAKSVLLNANFAESSTLVGGADCDLIAGDSLVDIKTTTRAVVERPMIRQLLAYLLLAESARAAGHIHIRSYAPRAKCLGTLGFARKVRMASRT
ncbi:MAG: hypothetical protein RMJ98_03160, partial [Myxococcales bacterium]|nr:hypothetical protein [Polyangiaceae bacterium]MDW8248289.1 hypothetical protein [Myxococcales bacterium]